jgi:hypothetical protein
LHCQFFKLCWKILKDCSPLSWHQPGNEWCFWWACFSGYLVVPVGRVSTINLTQLLNTLLRFMLGIHLGKPQWAKDIFYMCRIFTWDKLML